MYKCFLARPISRWIISPSLVGPSFGVHSIFSLTKYRLPTVGHLPIHLVWALSLRQAKVDPQTCMTVPNPHIIDTCYLFIYYVYLCEWSICQWNDYLSDETHF